MQDVKVSALALLKMVMHARSGGNIEVMGLLLGKVDANVMVVFQKAAYSIYVMYTLVFLITDRDPNNHPRHQDSGFSRAIAILANYFY